MNNTIKTRPENSIRPSSWSMVPCMRPSPISCAATLSAYVCMYVMNVKKVKTCACITMYMQLTMLKWKNVCQYCIHGLVSYNNNIILHSDKRNVESITYHYPYLHHYHHHRQSTHLLSWNMQKRSKLLKYASGLLTFKCHFEQKKGLIVNRQERVEE